MSLQRTRVTLSPDAQYVYTSPENLAGRASILLGKYVDSNLRRAGAIQPNGTSWA